MALHVGVRRKGPSPLLADGRPLEGGDAGDEDSSTSGRQILVIIAVALILGLLLPTPFARGSNDKNIVAGQNSDVTVGLVSLTSAVSSAVGWNDSNNYEPTDMTMSLYSGDGREVDVYDANYGDTSWVGHYFCEGISGTGTVCLYGTVQVNLYHVPSTNTDYNRAVVCHELGHAVGLAHELGSWSSCMISAPTSTTRWLSSHDIGIINSHY